MKSRLRSYFLFELNFLLVFLLIHVGLHLDVTFLDAILILPLTETWTTKLFIDQRLSRDCWCQSSLQIQVGRGWLEEVDMDSDGLALGP